MICFNSVGCLWQFHGKNPVGLYPKLQSQPIGLPKIFIDYLFFKVVQNLYQFLIDLLPLKNVEIRTCRARVFPRPLVNQRNPSGY